MTQCLTNGEEVLEGNGEAPGLQQVQLLEVITTPPATQGSPFLSPTNLVPMQTLPNTSIGYGQGPGAATTGMSPAAFEAWATSVEDYGFICNWALPLAASYVRLLCSGEVQQRINSRIDKLDFRKLETQAAIHIVRSVVIGPRCEPADRVAVKACSQPTYNPKPPPTDPDPSEVAAANTSHQTKNHAGRARRRCRRCGDSAFGGGN
ncbi:hypothetical protein Pmani_005210 [Petrolisthes manimaculis]|uniref:Uncharacterized protein n=1 Tax=Petrolisthes manimaculis TaxID=1843537 RepID=A0AAE1QEF7_9EUCA|nr:hypothetical protein Pmani_005210 [Petrolisthes manimaculis]